ncbi:MAG: aldo/keto reductase [Candidatus Aminicenantes bacterium]
MKKSRRIFLKNILCGAFSASLIPAGYLKGVHKTEQRIKKGPMFYRRLGRTNLSISEISLGGSPLPSWAVLLEAVNRGVNYIDTSESYQNGNSERQIGRLFKQIGREKVQVGTKFHLRRNWSEESILNSVHHSLRRLQTDYIDVLLIHGASSAEQLTDERVLSALEKLKKEGKYRFRGLSCHRNHHEVVKKAVDCGYYDMIQLAFNVFDIQEPKEETRLFDDYLGESGIRPLLKLASAHDMGIIAMKTLKVGGRKQNLEPYKTGETTIHQAMLKWVLENKNVSSAVIEMLSFGQLEEDLAAVGSVLSVQERQNLFRHVAENSGHYCHLCGCCEEQCPQDIKTTSILHCLTYYESYHKRILAREAYSRLNPSQTAVSCQNCGRCEQACPYGVAVRDKIREAHSRLG